MRGSGRRCLIPVTGGLVIGIAGCHLHQIVTLHNGTHRSVRGTNSENQPTPSWSGAPLLLTYRARRPILLRGQTFERVAKEASTAASTCRRVVGKTGTGLSVSEISSSISVQPSTTPSAPA